jgi:GT2 family glycosyltransferase
MLFSIVVAVFKRKDELEELLHSLTKQKFTDFEVIISDGSPTDELKEFVQTWMNRLPVVYVYRKGYRASESRNEGANVANGQYLIFLDSDVIAPADYLSNLSDYLLQNKPLAFGGPDAASDDFTPVMKGINHAMTSFLTTGGIRGRKGKVSKYQLRGFNMGLSKELFQKLNGFSSLQVAEDIELSVRIEELGIKPHLVTEAFVYHKRKSTLSKFAKQLYMHGKGRVDLNLRHPGQIKWVHLIPSLILVFTFFAVPLSFFISIELFTLSILLLITYFLAIFITASITYQSFVLGSISTIASGIMLYSYGLGLIVQFFKRYLNISQADTNKSEELKL